MSLADDAAAAVGAWFGAVTAALTALGALLGLPPVFLLRRRRRLAEALERRTRTVLPARVRLVARTDETTRILDHLGRGEYVIAIEGSIGVGKSALAMEVAHRLAEDAGRRDRAHGGSSGTYEWLVWIDAHNRLLGLADIARSLSLASGDASLAAAPAEHKAEALQSFLAAHPSVLVIDNLRLAAAETEHVAHFLRNLPPAPWRSSAPTPSAGSNPRECCSTSFGTSTCGNFC